MSNPFNPFEGTDRGVAYGVVQVERVLGPMSQDAAKEVFLRRFHRAIGRHAEALAMEMSKHVPWEELEASEFVIGLAKQPMGTDLAKRTGPDAPAPGAPPTPPGEAAP